MRIRDWSSDVCSSYLRRCGRVSARGAERDRAESVRRQWPALSSAHQRRDVFGARRRGAAMSAVFTTILDGLEVAMRLGVHEGEVTTPQRVRLSVWRSEEHTSELQSLMRTSYAVFCLKKKQLVKQD